LGESRLSDVISHHVVQVAIKFFFLYHVKGQKYRFRIKLLYDPLSIKLFMIVSVGGFDVLFNY